MSKNKKTVILVDDAKTFLKSMEVELQSEDYEFKTLTDGYYLFDEIERNKPALIILDIQMPKFDGEKTCRVLKNSEEYKDIPIIISTGTADTIAEQKAKMFQADEYITKPYDYPKLKEKIKKYLNQE